MSSRRRKAPFKSNPPPNEEIQEKPVESKEDELLRLRAENAQLRAIKNPPKLIPEPTKRRPGTKDTDSMYDLQKAMGLGDKDDRFNGLKSLVSLWLHRHIQMNGTWSDFSLGERMSVVTLIADDIPFFRHFVEAWPARVMAQQAVNSWWRGSNYDFEGEAQWQAADDEEGGWMFEGQRHPTPRASNPVAAAQRLAAHAELMSKKKATKAPRKTSDKNAQSSDDEGPPKKRTRRQRIQRARQAPEMADAASETDDESPRTVSQPKPVPPSNQIKPASRPASRPAAQPAPPPPAPVHPGPDSLPLALPQPLKPSRVSAPFPVLPSPPRAVAATTSTSTTRCPVANCTDCLANPLPLSIASLLSQLNMMPSGRRVDTQQLAQRVCGEIHTAIDLLSKAKRSAWPEITVTALSLKRMDTSREALVAGLRNSTILASLYPWKNFLGLIEHRVYAFASLWDEKSSYEYGLIFNSVHNSIELPPRTLALKRRQYTIPFRLHSKLKTISFVRNSGAQGTRQNCNARRVCQARVKKIKNEERASENELDHKASADDSTRRQTGSRLTRPAAKQS
ncbi:hypothetical protein C8F01DRAFT_1262420 [Mycena amicta]|nr:hypothetical protein C8F01DRAFT_1262420 [Mycena amicta]